MQQPIDIAEINQALFDRSFEGLMVLNKERTVRLVNPRAEEMLDYEPGELNNGSLDDLVPEEFHEECHLLWTIFFSPENNNSPLKTIVTFRKKSGAKVVAEVSMSNHLHEFEGQLVIVLFSDITARFKMEQELKKEKDLYVNVLETIGDAFISIDNKWRYTYANNIALQRIGKAFDEIKGVNIWEIFPQLKGTLYEVKYREVMESRQALSFEVNSILQNEWLEIRVCPHDSGIAVFSRNISEIKKKAIELKRLNKLFEKSFRSAPVALAIMRFSDGVYKDVNDSFLDIFEYKYEEVIGENPLSLGIYSREERDNFTAMLLEKGNIRNLDLRFTKRTGVPLSMLVSAEMITLDDEDHILLTMIDISDKKLAEESMIRLNEFLEHTVRERTFKLTEALEREKESNDLKSRFVSTASHEFRTPLTAVLSSLSLLEYYIGAEKNEKLKKHFNRIKLSVNNLTEILNDFLSLEKINKGITRVSSVAFNMKEMAEDVIDLMQSNLKKEQYIRYTHSGTSDMIRQDKNIIHNILLNLVSNASKYSAEGKSIELYSEISNGQLEIVVVDQGIGIPEADQRNIFTVFFRARNAESIQGTGLGLNIVKKYVELAGGTISFTSTEGAGSTFKLCFPEVIE